MSNYKPTRKQAANGVTGAVVLLAVYVAGQFGHDLPAEVAAAAVLVLSWAGGYLIPERYKGEHATE